VRSTGIIIALAGLMAFGAARADAQGILSPMPSSNGVYHSATLKSEVWFGTSKGVVRTAGSFSQWLQYGGDTAFANRGIFAIAGLGDTVWASTGYDKESDGQSTTTGSGLTYTFDAGLTWRHVPQPVDGRGDSIIVYGANRIKALPVVVPEQNVIYGLSVAPHATWIASWAGGIRKSTDNGGTWQRVLLPPDTLDAISPDQQLNLQLNPRNPPEGNRNHLGFSVLALSDSIIWAGTAGGVNVSTDGGSSWRKFTHQNQVGGILANWVTKIKAQSIPSGWRIWTTNWPAEDPDERRGVSCTDDNGQTWHRLLERVKCYDFAFRDSVVFVASDDGPYRTSDLGASWTKTNRIVDTLGLQVITSNSAYTVAVSADTVWVGTSDGIAATRDDSVQKFGLIWSIARAAQPVADRAAAYVYPNPFSPSTESVRIHYAVVGAGWGALLPYPTVSIDIFDFAMNRVRTLLSGASRPPLGQMDELWDGRDDGGSIVPNGVYFVRIRINDDDPLWAKALVIR